MKKRTLFPILLLSNSTLGLAACSGSSPDDRAVEPHEVAQSVRIAESERCQIRLVQVSYDDPSADNEERIVLSAVGPDGSPFSGTTESTGGSSSNSPANVPESPPTAVDAGLPEGPCGPGSSGHDAGSDAPAFDAGAERTEDGGSTGLATFGACGLDRIELVNGGNDACPVYRSIPLADVPVPADGFLTICSSDSILGQAGACDLTTAGEAQLKNGWIQNGPADALRFIGPLGGATEIAYEGDTCVGPGAISLVEESGSIDDGSGVEVDDVNVWCGDRFVLAPASRVDPRKTGPCPAPEGGDAGALGDSAGTHQALSQATDAARGRGTASGGGVEPPNGSATQKQTGTEEPLPLLPDSGQGGLTSADAGSTPRPAPPQSISCAAGRPWAPVRSPVFGGLLAGAMAAWRRGRRGRARTESARPRLAGAGG